MITLLRDCEKYRENYYNIVVNLAEIKRDSLYLFDGVKSFYKFLSKRKLGERLGLHTSTIYNKIKIYEFLKDNEALDLTIEEKIIKYCIKHSKKPIKEDLKLPFNEFVEKYPSGKKKKHYQFPAFRVKKVFKLPGNMMAFQFDEEQDFPAYFKDKGITCTIVKNIKGVNKLLEGNKKEE